MSRFLALGLALACLLVGFALGRMSAPKEVPLTTLTERTGKGRGNPSDRVRAVTEERSSLDEERGDATQPGKSVTPLLGRTRNSR